MEPKLQTNFWNKLNYKRTKRFDSTQLKLDMHKVSLAS